MTPPTDAAHEAYDRLIAAQRVIDPAEQAEMERAAERTTLALRMRRKMPRVY